MPNKVTLFSTEFDSNDKQINGRNKFLTNFVLPVKTDLNRIKLMTIVDSKIKSVFNRNKLSDNNTLNELLDNVEESNSNDGATVETKRDLDQDNSLSMNFGIYFLRNVLNYSTNNIQILCFFRYHGTDTIFTG